MDACTPTSEDDLSALGNTTEELWRWMPFGEALSKPEDNGKDRHLPASGVSQHAGRVCEYAAPLRLAIKAIACDASIRVNQIIDEVEEQERGGHA